MALGHYQGVSPNSFLFLGVGWFIPKYKLYLPVPTKHDSP